MISEASCDTEDWSNDDENSLNSQINCILKYIQLLLNCNNISLFYCIFIQINVAFLSIRDFF